MRDFNTQKVYFFGLDGSIVNRDRYNGIARYVNSNKGASLADFLQGEQPSFRVGFNKALNRFSENRLFVPRFRSFAGYHSE